MKGQTHGGKGSTQRPTDQAKYEANWESIFGSKLRGLRGTTTDTVGSEKAVQTVPKQTHNSWTEDEADKQGELT